MQAWAETIFDIFYLTLIITIGVLMVRRNGGRKQYYIFGIMALVLGCGDAFHLVPRAVALCTTGLENYTAALGIGKLITSITMTVFYVLLYYVWRLRYRVHGEHATTVYIYILAAARIVLCCMPQNEWLRVDPPLLWGILRNIPFALLGIEIIILFYHSAKRYDDRAFRWMWLTIVLSFSFYIPVVLFAHIWPIVGMLMIPKTLAYIWTVLIGFNAMRKYSEPAFRQLR